MEITEKMTAPSCPDGVPYFLEDAYLREAAELCSLASEPCAVFMQEAKEIRESRARTAELWHAHYMLNVIDQRPIVENKANFFMSYAVLAAMPMTKAAYRMRNIPMQLLKDSAQDLQIWAVDCHDITGKWGNMHWLWLRNTFNLSVFRLGRLQFELRKWIWDNKLVRRKASGRIEYAALDEESDDEVLIMPQDTYINVHIPALAPLDYEECRASLRAAKVFYAKHFPHIETRGFMCYSWLMDRALSHCLQDNSNIMRFQSLFEEVIVTEGNDRQHRERILGDANISLDKAPRNTTLQRNFISCLEKGIEFRPGRGIIVKG